jgi:hypothetical protein
MMPLPFLDIGEVLEEPCDVPTEWRHAYKVDQLRTEHRGSRQTHPFYKRFAVDTTLPTLVLAYLIHFMRLYDTNACYQKAGRTKRRVALYKPPGLHLPTPEHWERLRAVAAHVGCHSDDVHGLDAQMRAKRDGAVAVGRQRPHHHHP